MSLVTTFYIRPTLLYKRSRSGGEQPWTPPFGILPISLLDGIASGQANRMFDGQRTLAASDDEELNLFDGSLLDVFEVALPFVKVKVLYLAASPGNTHNVEVGGAASNAFLGVFKVATDTLVLEPGVVQAFVHPTTGWTVSNTLKMLKVANSGVVTPVTYDIAIAGTDA